ncbi:molybdopterin-dependent oxidoreductase [Frigoribacterium faeni]|uniref:DMSO/TMAO reductase YedYZ molybdopterin-dependent catalytic subunit n=1 Tax=Frigoribacterium faeni TaxID=145483 RepID=A0A7W3JHY1_9MICO|nr:molybdopterin-dependent oxidoreductase [Frigoribacterium faeni]MBA8813079.1 DMSO/TMAO reductase YedYZ molybdopterin-dependent catalytic subunit [Frigoribacterium faeni]GEK84021.1 oxidoreductase [Frigoribacterium faeni]
MSVRLENPPRPADVGMTPRASSGWAALAGVVSVAAFLASAEIVALATGPGGSPLFGVGSAAIDLAPAAVKNLMVSLFGTGDKVALFVLMGVLLVVITAGAGVLEWRRPPGGKVVFGLGGVIALVAVLTRADGSSIDGAPTAVGTLVSLLVLTTLMTRLRRWTTSSAPGWAAATEPSPPLRGEGMERRGFLTMAVAVGVVSALAGTGARIVNATKADVRALRDALRLPKPAVAADPVPAGASLDVDGITPYVTPTGDFYRIDTALQVPSIDPADWSLRIHGLIDREVTITFDELLALPLEEHYATLSCVSNEVGGDLIGTALWLGHPIRTLLGRAGPAADADMVLSTSSDGFTAGTPLDVLLDDGTDAILAVGMNGEPLPQQHGFPVRMVVPGLFGYVSATKWVVDLEVTRFADAEGYWTPRGWDALGPVKLESRIDTPKAGASVDAGTVPIAGVAWHPHTGVSRVEVRIDGGEWVEAELADSVSADTWVQWVHRWDAASGDHTVQVRATGADGVTQSESPLPPAPNGAEGWDEHTFSVR